MSILTPDNIKFTPSPSGATLIANRKPLAVDTVKISDGKGFFLSVDATAKNRTNQLAVSFDSEFLGDLAVNTLELYRDDEWLGTITRQVEDTHFTLYAMQQGFVYIVGLTLDFAENTNSLTINRYKGTLNNGSSVAKNTGNQDLSLVDTLLGMVTKGQAKDMISTDPNNDLKLGSDNKLFVNTQTHLTQADW